MTITQSFKIYEVLQKHFKNEADAKTVVQEIEEIIDTKFEKEKNRIATKDDINLINQNLLKFQTDMERRFNNMIMWLVGTGIGVVGLILTIIKLFIVK